MDHLRERPKNDRHDGSRSDVIQVVARQPDVNRSTRSVSATSVGVGVDVCLRVCACVSACVRACVRVCMCVFVQGFDHLRVLSCMC